MSPFVPCRIAHLPEDARALAAARSIGCNPHNALHGHGPLVPAHLTSLVGKLWKPGTALRVGFLGPANDDLYDRIVAHMNAWADRGVNVRFVRSRQDPQVRISLKAGGGHWSFLGTDILSAPGGQATMNLDGFSMSTPESEFVRVVRHETGHTLGFPHEHSRPEIVAGFDPEATIAYYRAWQGWDERTIRDQILDPLTAGSWTGTTRADPTSVMCYPFPDKCLRPGAAAVPGGMDINDRDIAYARSVYPGGAVVPTGPGPARPGPTQPAPAPEGVPIFGVLTPEALDFALGPAAYNLPGPFARVGESTVFHGQARRLK
jgi:hypothetical protein